MTSATASPEFAVPASGQAPEEVITTSLNHHEDGRELVVAAHADSIQAMLITSGRFRDLEVMIKGRVGGDEEPRIVSDTLYQAFMKRRVEREKCLRARSHLSAEDSSDGQDFQCGFFAMNELVDAVMSGKTNTTHLVVNFGGLTELEIGSDVASHSQLAEYAAALIFEVHSRQFGKVTDSILADRLVTS